MPCEIYSLFIENIYFNTLANHPSSVQTLPHRILIRM